MTSSVTKTITASIWNAAFTDGSTLSGQWTASYDAVGNLLSVSDASFTVSGSGGTTVFTHAGTLPYADSPSDTSYEIHFMAQSGSDAYKGLYIDWRGMTPGTLDAGSPSLYTSVINASSATPATPLRLAQTGTTGLVTSSITGATFSDGSTLSGHWTASYDAAGNLLSVSDASFTVTGSGGTTTFTEAGTLPYANSPSNSSYEIHFMSQSGSAAYKGLYIDWRSMTPSSLYEGSPSLYTSVINTSSGTPNTPLRLVQDGTTGQGTLPTISGLPGQEDGQDNASIAPFATVVVSDPDSATSALITLTGSDGLPTDANGRLSGAGLTRTGTGTYTLATTMPDKLSALLQKLSFTPATGTGPAGGTTSTGIRLAINDTDGTAVASTSLNVTATCFLRGTLIETPAGERAVEVLAAGDEVMVLEDGRRVARPIRWAGGHRMDAALHGCGDEAYPVRIRAGAFGDGLPRRDLLVTPEHCILAEGGLVPARMLVNGGSILVDRSIPEYDFFHLELDRHGILFSEALPTESYLDTGNRALFGSDAVAARPAGAMPAAPVTVSREVVEPIWQRLRDRARAMGLLEPVAAVPTTSDADLRVLLDDGTEIRACWHDALRQMFRIPRGARPVRLLSRAGVPAELVGPFVDDRRSLGVPVERLVVHHGAGAIVLRAAELASEGWHEEERGVRWTDGSASIELPHQVASDMLLDVHMAGTGCYRAA
ncbi:Hint domain-containing protein [Rhizosaccharibacter radicis]|uniref:Hint domain-containing protein n=1 Tax=Rhizosaccharibacter radicis TaxID=2782605 RepID=A0ABT1W1B9_9PROT|nr:Hint domain-containing protein [Acetobacteraceae bacterium KSS12]